MVIFPMDQRTSFQLVVYSGRPDYMMFMIASRNPVEVMKYELENIIYCINSIIPEFHLIHGIYCSWGTLRF